MNSLTAQRGDINDDDLQVYSEADSSFASDAPDVPLLTHILSVLRRRKWLILGVVGAALLAGLIFTLLATPLYTAVSTIEIQRESTGIVDVAGARPKNEVADQEFYETQYGLLESRALAERVATNLRLYDDVKFFDSYKLPQRTTWFQGGRVNPRASRREDRIELAGAILLKNFKIKPARLSRLVTLSFTSPDPVLSRRVVDAWSGAFVELTLERRVGATAYVRTFLERQLAQLRNRIYASEQQLVSYARQEKIVNLPVAANADGQSGSSERALVVDDLATINQEYAQARGDRIKAQSRLGQAGGSVSESLTNGTISALRQRRAELAANYARMMVQFSPGYPAAQQIKTEMTQLDRSISAEEGRVGSTLNETYRASVERENSLKRQVDTLTQAYLNVQQRSIQYNLLQRDVDTNRQLYAGLLQRYKAISADGGVGTNNIAVVDSAELPVKPSSPRLLINLAIALIGGLGLGVISAFLVEQINQNISDAADIESLIGIPTLGAIPKVMGQDPREALADRKSSMSEAYLSLRTNLSFSTDHGIPRSILVTSTRPAEGKSTTSYALATVIARSGKRVVLIDSDMRSPSLNNMLNVTNEFGLSNYLAGDKDLTRIIHPLEAGNLFFIAAGPQPPSAAELLASDNVTQLIADLLLQFDHVIFDAPPVMGLADAPLLSSEVEGVVYVLEANATDRRMVRVAMNRLRSTRANVIGAVLTKFEPKRSQYGYGYDYGYGYGNASSKG
ncbi:capsular exopolysaccharide synthesis family protein [Sphingomonas sp. PP-CE-1A-559]|uniref:GumC family protein n=1 Tax=Sphingomonas sp. PP-CE-1A-559 TaxID=2135657 RepID=UPI0010553FC6|nr:polysaccharide biosynthesis tyrosine autokinase [Sphingomonas sp. PP-CE-1A-559]TCP87594.1 capsular exopolysaccharide synthesis family protein [Sphingomonas sp. PP-CE-1A-559]